jgi:hypothetical protein
MCLKKKIGKTHGRLSQWKSNSMEDEFKQKSKSIHHLKLRKLINVLTLWGFDQICKTVMTHVNLSFMTFMSVRQINVINDRPGINK